MIIIFFQIRETFAFCLIFCQVGSSIMLKLTVIAERCLVLSADYINNRELSRDKLITVNDCLKLKRKLIEFEKMAYQMN
jgi:hypothetical protein